MCGGLGGWFGQGPLLMILFWAFLLGGGYLLLQKSMRLDRGQRVSPLETLQMRYVKGEISREEFEKIKADL